MIKNAIKVMMVILCVVIVFVGCNDSVGTNTIKDVLGPAESKNTISVCTLDIDKAVEPIGISGKYFYYMHEKENTGDACDYIVVQYDLIAHESKNIAKINNLSAWSATYAFVNNDKFFSTFGTVENNISVNQHLMVDALNGTASVLTSDDYFPPLIQSISVNESCYLEFQPQQLGDGIYRYTIRIGDIGGKTNDIIIKERGTDQNDEMIVDVCAYANTIYTFEYDGQDAYVCSYDLNGNLISKESIDFVNEFLNTPNDITGATETMWSINVINGYYFFETLNGCRLVLFKSEIGWEKREDLIMSQSGMNSDLIVNLNPLDENYKKVLLYDYSVQKLFCLDTEDGKLECLDLNIKNATHCITDGKQLVFQNDKQEFAYVADVFAK